jgi:hypothetical protein
VFCGLDRRYPRKGAGMILLFDFFLGVLFGFLLVFLWGFFSAWWRIKNSKRADHETY